MGLLTLLAAFVATLGMLSGMASAATSYFSDTASSIDPEGWVGSGPDWPIFMMIAAFLALSAAAGTVSRWAWLSRHQGKAAAVGVAAAVTTAAVLAVTAIVWTSAPEPIASAMLMVGRAFAVVGPGLTVGLAIRTMRGQGSPARRF